MPLYFDTAHWKDVDHSDHSLYERLAYRAERRNIAVEDGLKMAPEASHILMIDSFYLSEAEKVNRLCERYEQMKEPAVLGPAIWACLRTDISQVLHPMTRFYDAWSTPEMRWCPYGWKPEHDKLTGQEQMPLEGFYEVSSVGGMYLFPRSIWENGARYAVPERCHGCEHNGFHASHDLPVYVDTHTSLFRTKKYSLLKCARVSVGNWRRTR